MFSNKLKRLSLIVLIALALTLGVLLLLPSLLKPSLNRLLPELLGTEKEPARVQLESLSWTGFKLKRLEMTLSEGGRLELTNLQVRYRPSDLLHARIGRVTLDRVALTWTESNLKEVAAEAADDARQAAQASLNQVLEIPALSQLLRLPLDSLRIDQITIKQPLFNSQLEARIDEALLRVNGQLTLTEVASPWQVELQLHPSGRWFFMLTDDSQLLAQQNGTLRQDKTHTYIQLDQRIDLAALGQRYAVMDTFPLPLDDLRLQAAMRLPNAGMFPAEATLALNAWVTTKNAKLGGEHPWQASTWAIDITKASPQGNWFLTLASAGQKLRLQHPSLFQTVYYQGFQQAQADCQANLSQCQLNGHLSAQLLSQQQQSLAQLDIYPQLNWGNTAGAQLTLPIRAKAQASQIVKDFPVQNMHLSGELSASLHDSLWQLSSDQGFGLTLDEQRIEGWQQQAVSLNIMPSLQLQGDLNSDDLRDQFAAQTLSINIKPFTLSQAASKDTARSEINLAASQLSCRPYLASNNLSVGCQLLINSQKSSFEGWPIPQASLTGSFLMRQLAESTGINSELELHAANGLIRTRINTQHNLDTGKGGLQWHLEDVKLNWNTLDLAEMLALTKVDLLSGSIAGQGWIDWQQQDEDWLISPDSSLRIDGVSGIYDNTVAFEGWNALVALRRPFMGNYLLDAQLSGASLNPGVELKNTLARSQTEVAADFSWALANIYEVRTDLLGGSVSTPLIRYDTRSNNNRFNIELNRIQLAQVVALEPSSEIQATGTLDGLLPILITPAGAEVPAGSLFARDPGGNLRYHNQTSESLAQSNQSMGLAMQLLSNFNYDKLQADVSYQPNGMSNLDLQFQGRNPDFFNGQVTHLNVGLEYNLLDLLESLRAADNLIHKIEEKYQ